MVRLAISLLGPFYVTLHGEPAGNFEYDKVRALLAYLCVNCQRPHRREMLAGLLWPNQSDRAARNSLRQALATLRKAIQDPSASPAHLIVANDQIQFNCASDYSLDTRDFVELLRLPAKHHHRRTGLCSACVRELEQAVALYHGDFLEQFSLPQCEAYEEWASAWRAEFHQCALDALERVAGYYERLRAYPQVQAVASRHLALDCFREKAHRQMMRALAFRGQSAAALRQYQACRRLLARELGVEPDEKTRQLYEQIKSGAWRRTAGLASDRVHNVPAYLIPFVGRETELHTLAERLENANCRLTTITGLGGVGKTRLAIEAAARAAGTYTHGIHFVEFAAVRSPQTMVAAIADALKLSFSNQLDAKEQLINHLRARDLLLVLDNVEHLLPDAARLVADILQRAPEVACLVTSRERLNMVGDWVLELEGMDYPQGKSENEAPFESYSAVVFFLQHAPGNCEVISGLVRQEGDQIAEICRLVEGLPLALELSASMLPHLSCTEIASQLKADINALSTNMIGLPERHVSFQAVFDQSWRLMSTAERVLFSRLSVFQGGFQAEAAEQVANGSRALLQALGRKSLLYSNGNQRYKIHELLRRYGQCKLRDGQGEDEAKNAHLDYFTRLAEEGERHLTGEKQRAWLERLEIETGNLNAALTWSLQRGKADLRLAGALWRFWFVRGRHQEGLSWLRKVVNARADSTSVAKVKVLNGAGVLAHMQGDYEPAETYHLEALSLARQHDDKHSAAYSLHYLGVVVRTQGDFVRARNCYGESMALFQEIGDQRGNSIALRDLAEVAKDCGDLQTSVSLLEEAVALRSAIGDRHGVARLLNELGLVVRLTGALERAGEIHCRCLALFRELQDSLGVANALYHLARIACRQGEQAQAEAFFRESLGLFQELGDKKGITLCVEGLAAAVLAGGDVQLAAMFLAAAQDVRAQFAISYMADERAEVDRCWREIQAQPGPEFVRPGTLAASIR
jgi:predicted ATPase/DNA-binding SARP family transcriptional activator